ncbi:MAG TPA: SDR family NAD(P)-dependent oxidoreductase, partial [Dehalococcoidia bacterium]
MRFAGKTVVVTGAGGFIGSQLVEELVGSGAHVRAMLRYTSRGKRGCLDLLPESVLDNVAVTLGDVRDFDAVREVMSGADAVFHLAALVGIPYSYEHPQEVIDTNIVGTSNVLLAAKELASLERIVLTSTSEVYGSAIRIPMDEEHPLQAQSPYSATKIAADALGLSFHRSFALPLTIVRPFNAYGPRQSA